MKISTAQNLVPNPGFEIITSCPSAGNEIQYAVPWVGTNNDSEIYNACAPGNYGVPYQSAVSWQYAHGGDGFAGLWFANSFSGYREYIQVPLLDTLEAGECYQVSFYVNLLNSTKWMMNNISAHLSPNAFTTAGEVAPYTAQIMKFGNPMISDTVDWVLIRSIYTATGNERFLTIGNFHDDANTDTMQLFTGAGISPGYYYVDDVSIYSASDLGGSFPPIAGNDTLLMAGDSFFVGQRLHGLNCNWYEGSTLMASGVSGLYVYPTVTTTYTVEQDLCGQLSYDTVTVFVSNVGITEENLLQAKVYPNPASTELHIEHLPENCGVRIYDISGRLVYAQQSGQGITTITDLPEPGSYIVEIYDMDSDRSTRLPLLLVKP